MSTASPGTLVGRYRIEVLLGQGGMGQVFRAWDEVLHRRVALKVLRPPAVTGTATDAAATVRRILREARMVAALDHPNVVAIFDFGEHEGAPYIVMEHVGGASLRAFVGRGEVPAAVRLGWLVDVARALSAAHRAGLVHRDVKPENVMVRDDGVVKVLDFGIARRAAAEPASSAPPLPALVPGPDAPPADTLGGTLDGGGFSGTPAYMAPEQLRVGQLDARADQFAWGVLAYELLTGALPWRSGADVASVLRDVLLSEPAPLDAAALGISADVAAAVRRALAKDAGERFPSMDALLAAVGAAGTRSPLAAGPASASVRIITASPGSVDEPTLQLSPPLRLITASPVSVDDATLQVSAPVLQAALAPPAAAPAPAPARRPGGLIAAAAALLAAGAAGAWALTHRRVPAEPAPPPPPLVSAPPRFAPQRVRRLTFQRGCEEFPSLTPDGREVIFDATVGRDTHLVALDLVTRQQRQITAERGWQWAGAVSPDGRRVAYIRQQDGKSAAHLVPIEGGATRLLVAGPVRPSWSPDGRAVWAGVNGAPVRVDAETGAVTRTLSPPPGSRILAVMELADGRILARFGAVGLSVIRGMGLYPPGASSEPRMLTEDALTEALVVTPDGRWAITGRVTPRDVPQLLALPLEGGPPAVLPSNDVAPSAGMVLSRAGDLLLWSTCSNRSNLVALVRRPGGVAAAEPIGTQSDWVDQQPAWVPGSRRLVIVSTRVEGRHLWVLDREDREPARQLPTGPLEVDAPAVSPDGRWVVFTKVGDGLHVVPLDGSVPPRRLTRSADDGLACFSRDGATVYFQTRTPDGRPRIDALPFEGGAPRPIREGAVRPVAALGADLLAFVAVEGAAEEGVATLLDLRTGRARPLSPGLGPVRHVHFSPDARRAVVLEGSMGAVEIDVAKGAVLTRYDAGSDEITGLVYVGDELLVTHRLWAGNLWIGEDPFR